MMKHKTPLEIAKMKTSWIVVVCGPMPADGQKVVAIDEVVGTTPEAAHRVPLEWLEPVERICFATEAEANAAAREYAAANDLPMFEEYFGEGERKAV